MYAFRLAKRKLLFEITAASPQISSRADNFRTQFAPGRHMIFGLE